MRKNNQQQCDFYPCTSEQTGRYMVSGQAMQPAVRHYCAQHRELVKAAGLKVLHTKVQ